MNRFAYARAATWNEAQSLLADRRFSLPVLKGGGLDLLDQMKEGLIEPDLLIDVRGNWAGEEGAFTVNDMGSGTRTLSLDARTTLAQLARDERVNQYAPVLAQAAESAATPQVRNVATLAGNLLQRPRCWYFRHDEFDCLKKGGATCFAVDGENQHHAIFGGGPCHIVHPSNLAVALHALNAHVILHEPASIVEIADLFHLPDAGVRTEHSLPDRAAIVTVGLRAAPRSAFYAIKHKQSFDWPIVMAAVALELDGMQIGTARICAGAVAPIPWPLPRVAEALVGVRADDLAGISRACSLASEGATPMSQNAHKVRLLPVAVERAVLKALGRLPEELA